MPKSKYPENYDNISLGSDMSIYSPIVGEVNYVKAVLPPPVVVPEPKPAKDSKKKADKKLKKNEEEAKVPLPMSNSINN